MAFNLMYSGDEYFDFDWLYAWCSGIAERDPRWFSVHETGTTRGGRPLLLLTLTDHESEGSVTERPAIWLDAGTHASEYTSVAAVVFTLSRWIERVRAGDDELSSWLRRHAVHVMPCISPDGFQAMREGHPFVRSSLRPPKAGGARTGFEDADIDGDGRILQMRWPHPAG
ncbi:MAG: hypothetical protein KC561_20745, partial [Myxococcales bacterium]|nr:hypothetical protein [Myxococcales bacterium]